MMPPPQSRMSTGGQYDGADEASMGAQGGWYGPESEIRGSHRAQFGPAQGMAVSRMMPSMRREIPQSVVGTTVAGSSGSGPPYMPRGQSASSLSEGGSSKSSLEVTGSSSALQLGQGAQQSPMLYEQRDIQRKMVTSRSSTGGVYPSEHHFHAMQRSMPYARIPSRDDIASTGSGKSTMGVPGPPRHYSSVGASSGQSPATSIRTPTSVHSASPTIGIESAALYTLAGFAANEQPMRGARTRSYDESATMTASSTAVSSEVGSSSTWKRNSSAGLYRPDPETMAAGDNQDSSERSVAYTDRGVSGSSSSGTAMSPARQAGAKMAALAVSSDGMYHRQMGAQEDYGTAAVGVGYRHSSAQHEQPQAQTSPSES